MVKMVTLYDDVVMEDYRDSNEVRVWCGSDYTDLYRTELENNLNEGIRTEVGEYLLVLDSSEVQDLLDELNRIEREEGS